MSSIALEVEAYINANANRILQGVREADFYSNQVSIPMPPTPSQYRIDVFDLSEMQAPKFNTIMYDKTLDSLIWVRYFEYADNGECIYKTLELTDVK